MRKIEASCLDFFIGAVVLCYNKKVGNTFVKGRKWMMRNLEIWEDVFENGQLSVSKLQKTLKSYHEKANSVEELVRERGIQGDMLVQSFERRTTTVICS